MSELQAAVLAWGEHHRRDLPWRRTRDPWAVLVSELMLQQTQVPRVVPRWEAFLARFPTPAACAASPVGDVVRAWDGLGYNRRAVNLHRIATAVVDRHDGRLPSSLDDLLALPGVGTYTARAVQAFAFGLDVGLVEVNTARVLARLGVASDAPQEGADALVPAGEGWAWNQAMIDIGATVCRRRSPACGRCPLARSCSWAVAGWPPPDPAAPGNRQSAFAGSDRQGRGRLVKALRSGPVPITDLALATGWPGDPDRARRVADALVAEGLAERAAGLLRLP